MVLCLAPRWSSIIICLLPAGERGGLTVNVMLRLAVADEDDCGRHCASLIFCDLMILNRGNGIS